MIRSRLRTLIQMKIKVELRAVTRKSLWAVMLKVVVTGGGFGIVAWALWQPRLLLRRIAERDPDVLFYAEITRRLIALTIDDGPHPTVTPMVLDVLSRYQARATFFVIGERIRGNEDLIYRILSEGHELGNHMMTDVPSIRLGDAAFEDQSLQADRLLSRFSAVKWFRPASALYDGRMLRRIRQNGYSCVIGSVFPYDTHVPFVGFQSNFILGKAFPGSVLVLHEGRITRRRIAAVLDRVVPKLQSRGYSIVSLSELVEERRDPSAMMPRQHSSNSPRL
jgi:peptidoglycan/xylan/chitin deacetylase (PgdA/CDA1 family)